MHAPDPTLPRPPLAARLLTTTCKGYPPRSAAAAPVNVYAAAVDAMLRPVNASAAAVGTAGCCWVRTVLQSTPTPTDCPASQMSAPPPFARLAFSFSSHALRTLALLAAAATAQNRRPASTIHQTPVLPGLILIRPLSSQLVAHTGVAMVGAWSAQAAAALHPTHPQLTEAASVAPFSALTCHPTPPILPLAAYSPIFTFTSAFFPPPFSVLICPLSSQQVARTGVAVAGDMECTGSSCSPPNPPAANRSLAREWQWRGTWSAQAAAALHPTHPQLILSLQVEGRGVGVNTAAPSHPSPVAVQVAVVGGEGSGTPLGWDGMGECRAGSSEPRSLIQKWQWRGTWSAQAAAATHPQLSSCPASLLLFSLVFFAASPVEGRGVGVNTATPSRLSPVAVQVAVVGGEGGSTPLGWDGMGEYRAGSSESRSGSGKDMECTGSSRNPPAAKFLPCLSTPTLSCVPCCISCFFSLQTQASGSAKAWGSTPIGWGGRKRIGLGRLNQGHVGSGEGGSIPLGWDGKGEYRAGLSETRRHEGELWGGWEGSMGASGQLTALGAASSGVVRCGSGCGGWDLRGTALGAQEVGCLLLPLLAGEGGVGKGGVCGDGGGGRVGALVPPVAWRVQDVPGSEKGKMLPLHIKRAICAHHVENPRLRHVDLARWCYSHYGLRPDRSTVGRILKSAERRAVTATGDNQLRRRGGAWPELEQAMSRWIANAGPAGVPLTLQTIRDHVAAIARNMGIPPTFRCSIGWVRRALRRQGVRCRAAQGEAASADMAAVRGAREKLPQLLTHLGVTPRDTFNLDETALWLPVLPRRTYSNGRIPGRKVPKDRLTVAFLVNADGSHVFRPLVIRRSGPTTSARTMTPKPYATSGITRKDG
ncbi:unnamed protein product [Closterium sp. NIES-65]|nr:unnamed protein product [Closterium sp. NIES-65]